MAKELLMFKDIRQELSDAMIREVNAEIDIVTFRMFDRGERIILTESGPEWVHVVDADDRLITDPSRLKDLLG